MFIIVVILIGLQLGCATTPPATVGSPYQNSSIRLNKTAVIPADFLPKTSFNTFAKGRMSGAGKGVLKGFKVLLAAPAVGLAADAVAGTAGLGTLLGIAFGAVYLPVSPIVGAIKAVPYKESIEIERAIPNVLSKLRVQENFADHVIKASENNSSGYQLALVSEHISPKDKKTFMKN
jgi:hypothetical protein